MSHDDDENGSTLADRWTVLAALGAFLGILAAFVVLSVTDHDGQSVVRLVVDLSAIFGLGVVSQKHHKVQRRKLDKIEDQTNGALDERMKPIVKDATKAALVEILEGHLVDGSEVHETGRRR